MKKVSVLIPTFERKEALVITLTALVFQCHKSFAIIIADQNENYSIKDEPILQSVLRLLEEKGHQIMILKNLPRKGIAQLCVMEKYGGCGLLPSGAYHQELPTTIPDRSWNAPDKLL